LSLAGRAKIDVARWGGSRDTSRLVVRTGASGTFVLGVSTKPRVLSMPGAEFNA
jgi:hypothetical protein